MEVIQLCKEIGVPSETLKILQGSFCPPSAEDIKSFYLNPVAFLNKKKNKKNYNSFMLNFYLHVGATLAEMHFLKKGFTHEIYIETLKDIALWSEVYQFETGTVGLAESETRWIVPHMSGNIATLGRLQFKPSTLKEQLCLSNGQKFEAGTKVIEIHIPRGSALTRIKTEASMNEAAKEFGKSILYSCNSWLLSPTLKTLLAPSSNILEFADMFEIVDVDKKDNSGFRYLSFAAKTVKETTLTKAAKALCDDKKTIGSALGFFVR